MKLDESLPEQTDEDRYAITISVLAAMQIWLYALSDAERDAHWFQAHTAWTATEKAQSIERLLLLMGVELVDPMVILPPKEEPLHPAAR